MRILFLSCLLFSAFGAAVLAATDQQPTSKPSTTQPTTQQAAAKPVNKYCAVDQDNEVDPTVTITYKGMVIGFCCKDCIKDFEKDPEKYLKTMK
jgi:YHS domain-containing protein